MKVSFLSKFKWKKSKKDKKKARAPPVEEPDPESKIVTKKVSKSGRLSTRARRL